MTRSPCFLTSGTLPTAGPAGAAQSSHEGGIGLAEAPEGELFAFGFVLLGVGAVGLGSLHGRWNWNGWTTMIY